MTQPNSITRVVKLYLRDAIREELPVPTPDGGVQVSYARPETLDAESIWFGAVRFEQNYKTMKGGAERRPRDELGEVAVHIWTALSGRDPEDADLRASELHAVIEDIIATDITFGGLVMQAGINNGTNEQVPDDEGWSGYIRLNVAYAARLD